MSGRGSSSSNGCDVNVELFVDEDFKQANPYTTEEREAVRQKIISDGCLIDPVIIWKKNGTLVWGYENMEIAEELNLPYEVKYREFDSKADCLAWIGEKRLVTQLINLFQKIEIGKSFVNYWLSKDEAKHGKNSLFEKSSIRTIWKRRYIGCYRN